MPYDVLKVEGKYKVINQGDGKVLGTHDTRGEAEAQMRAVYHGERSHNSKPTPGARAGKDSRLNDSYEPIPISEVYVDGRKVNVGE